MLQLTRYCLVCLSPKPDGLKPLIRAGPLTAVRVCSAAPHPLTPWHPTYTAPPDARGTVVAAGSHHKLVLPGAKWDSVMRRGTMWCNVVQLGANWCNVQCGATWGNVVQ